LFGEPGKVGVYLAEVGLRMKSRTIGRRHFRTKSQSDCGKKRRHWLNCGCTHRALRCRFSLCLHVIRYKMKVREEVVVHFHEMLVRAGHLSKLCFVRVPVLPEVSMEYGRSQNRHGCDQTFNLACVLGACKSAKTRIDILPFNASGPLGHNRFTLG